MRSGFCRSGSTKPTYISQSRHGTYRIRIRVPERLRAFVSKQEIIKTLHTKERRTALRRAKPLVQEARQFFDNLERQRMKQRDSLTTGLITYGELKIEQESSEKEWLTFNRIMEKYPELITSQLNRKAPADTKIEKKLTSEVIESLLEDYKRSDSKNEKTLKAIAKKLERICLLLGNPVFSEISRPDIERFERRIARLPVNASKKFSDEHILTLVESDHSEQVIAPKTRHDHCIYLKDLLQFGKQKGWHHEDISDAVTSKKPSKNQTDRKSFTESDIESILSGYVYGGKPKPRESRSWGQFWLPLLGMYTGARLNELCQLTPNDIERDCDGTWYISINENDEKSVKTKAGIRNIPIHSKLIELGFIRFVEQRKREKCSSLLGWTGDQASRWFTRKEKGRKGGYFTKLGITDPGKVYHSFRHTAVGKLRNAGVEAEHIAAVAGHEQGLSTTAKYGNTYSMELLQGYIEKIKYDENLFAYVNWKDFERNFIHEQH